jgi:predicted PurR-regulated permease PerM
MTIDRKVFSRYFFLAVLLGTTVLFFLMVRPFLIPVLLAATFTTLFYPLFEWLCRRFRGRRSLAAFVTCFILLLGIVGPLYGVADMVAGETVEFYRSAEKWIGTVQRRGEVGPFAQIRELALVKRLGLDQIDWKSTLKDLASSAGSVLATIINKTSRGTIQVVVTLFMTLFTMFYFLRDGPSILRRLRVLIPLDREYKNALAARFTSVARATVRGTLLIAIIQGTLAGLTLWIFGVGAPILWGVVATMFSIVPLVGAWTVLYPAALAQLVSGHPWQALGIVLVTVLVISNVDNLLRPRLVGQETGMHDLMVFFSTLGGIGMFGPTGFIIGPMVAALFLSVIDIYSKEFKDHLDRTLPLGSSTPEEEPEG